MKKKAILFGILWVLGLGYATGVSSATSHSLAQVKAPAAVCGVISCTTYLPLIFQSIAPQFEVTQAVQQPDNSVLLIANRPTYVRWTLTSSTAYTNVTAYLYGTSNGVPLPGSPIAALNNPRTLKSTADRGTLNDTFNFNLPAAWTSGAIALSVQANNTTGYHLGTGSTTFQFSNARPLNITIVPINYRCNSGGSGTTTPAGPYNYLSDYTFRTYPVASIVTTTHSATAYSGPCDSSGVPTPASDDWDGMLDAVTTVYDADTSPVGYYYGLVHINCGGGCIAGEGWIGYPAAVGFDGFGASHSQASSTSAHEIGHNHGRYHAPGCGVAGPDSNYPYVSGGKSLIGNSTAPNYGFDIVSRQIYPYAGYYDFMGYCNPTWVSDYTYAALYAYDNSGYSAVSSQTSGQRALLISGSIDPRSERVSFRPAYALAGLSHLPDPGDHTLELIDAQGHSVAAYSFTPMRAQADRFPADAGAEYTGFNLSVPYTDDVASIRVRHGSTLLGELHASAHAPSLAIKSAVFNAETRSNRISWSGSDPAGASLQYLVRASIDQGATWQTIGVNLSEPYIDLGPTDFAGQHVLIQVLASNGLRTTTLQIGPYDLQP